MWYTLCNEPVVEYLTRCVAVLQVAGGQELAGAQEAQDRAGRAPQLEALLGVSQGHHPALLRLRRGDRHHTEQRAPTHPGYGRLNYNHS